MRLQSGLLSDPLRPQLYRHGLRVSEACDLRWDDIYFAKRTIMIRRLKGSHDLTHYLERDELGGLKQLHKAQVRKAAYVFINERGQPFGRMGIARLIERAGEAAGLPFPSTCWPAAGFVDTEIGCFMKPEGCHAKTEVQSRVQGRSGSARS